MNRYDRHFRSLTPFLQSNLVHRTGYARAALVEHRFNGFGPEDDDSIVRQFDLSGLDEFWDAQLSEPLGIKDFTDHLSVHFIRAGSSSHSNMVRISLVVALRAARAAAEPWFIEIPDQTSNNLVPDVWVGVEASDTLVVPPDPPLDGIDLSKLRVRPRAAAEWLLSMPKRRHLVPPSLAAFLQRDHVAEPSEPASSRPAKSARGRPGGTGYQIADREIARQMIKNVQQGKATSLSAAARDLIGRDGKGALGNGLPPAKVERLVKVANKMKDEDNRA